MDEFLKKLSENFGYATPFLYAAGAYKLFDWLDEKASDDAKALLASTMNLKEKSTKDVASALVEVFDRIYTFPLWSRQCLLRSILFSVVVTIVYAYEYLNLRSDLFHVFRDVWNGGPRKFEMARLYGYYYGGVLLTNAVTDYVSLFIIRPWLMRAGSRPVLALLFAILLGVHVVCLGAAVRAWIASFTTCFCELLLLPTSSWPLVLWDRTAPTIAPALVVFAWLPLFALGILAVRILRPLSWFVSKVKWGLKDGAAHPLKAVAIVAAAVVLLVGVGIQILKTHGHSATRTEATPNTKGP
jgi:hypothetical protein